jgi:ATP/maltotriose-dependent transcriptional regulator MalT
MYDEAYRISAEFLSTSEQYRLDFARPYALCSFALASVGLRHWGRARAALEEAHRLARKRKDSNAGHLAHAQLLRLFAQRGRYGSALALETPSLEGALNASRAEVLLSRALVLACAGRVDEALALTDKARTLSRAVEPRVLVAAVEAVSAVRSRDRNMLERLSALELAAFDTGGVDLLVTTYRACPELLPLLLKVTVERDRLHALLRRARDGDLAASVGYSVSPENNPLDRLTAREREIYEFLLRGVSNQEIAEALYISRATAKRHVQNIYNKLGLRSRAAIAVQAALARSSQATAATEASPSSDSSSRGSRPN